MTWLKWFAVLFLAAMLQTSAWASGGQDNTRELQDQIDGMQQKILEMQAQLDELRAQRDAEEQKRAQVESRLAEVEDAEPDDEQLRKIAAETYDEKDAEGIKIGGAVRFQYKYEDYARATQRQGGVFEMDTIRLNFDGSIGDVLLSAELRHYDYMDVVHHAWVGYDFTDSLQGQVGVNQVPFGILPFNSHSFFFSSNYYVGLEDDNDFGVKLIYDEGPLNLQGAFYLNDEHGGADSSLSASMADKYSYNIVGVRAPGEDTFDNPTMGAFDNNIFNARAAYTLGYGSDYTTELGVSGQYGDVVDEMGISIGDQHAWAAHLNGNYGPWNLQLQAAQYDYNMDSGADRMVVGAYAYFDTIASKANVYTGNIAYNLPVEWGPISHLTFYNDYSLITDKSANLADTWMNVTGVSITAGGLFAYLDILNGKNQPFLGGTMDNEHSGRHNRRLNLNLGYYF